MTVIAKFSQTEGNYGPLAANFRFNLSNGYTVLTGENNSGKSAVLQFIFRSAYHDKEFGADSICFIPPNRDFVGETVDGSGQSLMDFNKTLHSLLQRSTLVHSSDAIQFSNLPKILLHSEDYAKQISLVNESLAEFGFSPIVAPMQRPHSDKFQLLAHGAGLRSIFYILAALSLPRLKLILIDEPERGLEPRLQKKLRMLLMQAAEHKIIVIATHSHLFLDTGSPEKNRIVEKRDGDVHLRSISAHKDLIQIIYPLLGNSTQDLLFPGNFLVVEGASDQVICEKIVCLLGSSALEVKVLAATGVEKIEGLSKALENNLRPLVNDFSPYARKVVAITDNQNDQNKGAVRAIRELLRERCITLPEISLEKYIPDALYSQADMEKATELDKLARSNDILEQRKLKEELSKKIASKLSTEDLELIPEIRDAVAKAIDLSRT